MVKGEAKGSKKGKAGAAKAGSAKARAARAGKDKGKGAKGKGAKGKGAKGKGAKGKPKGPSLASRADKYVLYQRSVQEPDADIDFMQQAFREAFGRDARTVREDFCAAAYLACTWVRRYPDGQAWGVDLDPEPLGWGLRNNAVHLNPEQRERLHLIQGNVLDPRPNPKVDIVTAQNFSYCVFKQRELLRRYFSLVREALKDEGLFVMDLFGGPEAQIIQEEEWVYDGFSYVWDQDRYNPINNEILCHIHYRFPDKSELRHAFSYDWRLWTIRELRELLAEAGFRRSVAYWEGATAKGDGNGIFTPTEEVGNDDAWIAYVVGIR